MRRVLAVPGQNALTERICEAPVAMDRASGMVLATPGEVELRCESCALVPDSGSGEDEMVPARQTTVTVGP